MLVYLNSHDFPDFIYRRHTESDGTYDERQVRRIVVSQTATVDDMATAIINNPAPMSHRSIWRLFIRAHGASGSMALGTGLSIENVSALAPLRGYFTPLSAGGRGVLLDSCLVASDSIQTESGRDYLVNPFATPIQCQRLTGVFTGSNEGMGLRFLRLMARTLHTKVVAGIQVQSGVNGVEHTRIEGSYIEVFPDGHYNRVVQAYTPSWIHFNGNQPAWCSPLTF